MMKSEFLKKYTQVTVAVLFLVAAFSRLWMLGHAAFRADTMEFYKYVLRNQSIIEFWKNPPWKLMIPVNETLSLLMLKIGLPAMPFSTRLPFALMGILAVFFVWKFARHWFGSGAALFVLLLTAFNPYQLYHSRDAYHYSGVICWSAALFLAFWSIKETLQQNKAPTKKQLVLWFLAAVAVCHMHMSVWITVGLQGLLILIFGFKLKNDGRTRFLQRFFIGSILLGGLMSRWIVRAAQEIIKVAGANGGGEVPAGLPPAGPEFLRLLPAYFAGENLFAIALLFIFVALAVLALFCASDATRRFRSLAWICALHIVTQMIYLVVAGGGVSKITYFSAIWPHFILLTGIGAYLGVRALASGLWRTGLYVLLAGSYVALTAGAGWAIINLQGHPAPIYKINDWFLKNLPAGTPILTDRWFHPWNELAVHNPGNINYTFTVPDEPLENYRRFNWRATAEQFFEKYPEAAFLEVARGRYDKEMGPWAFKQTYFARQTAVTNEPALVLRRMNVFPQDGFSAANTNGVVTRIFYNTTEDLIAAARKNGCDVLRLYGAGWGYAKPGWQQGQFEDYRILSQSASIDLYNLKEVPLSGILEISAATADKPKTVSVNGVTTGFASGRIRTWAVPLTLQSGKNAIPFSSPSGDPLFVLDIRWKPAQP